MLQKTPGGTGYLTPVYERKHIDGATIACFGRGFGWKNRNFVNFAQSSSLLLPLLEQYDIKEAIVPDFRGFNGLCFDDREEKLLPIYEKDGYKLLKTPGTVDAVITKLSVAAITADCHVGYLIDAMHGTRAVIHFGRNAAYSPKHAPIIDVVCRRMWPTDPKHVSASLWCGIGAKSFENHTTEAHRELVDALVREYGNRVLVGAPNLGCINMPKLFETQLMRWGVPKEQISWDGVDTYRHPRLHSRRRQNRHKKETDGSGSNNCVLIF